MNETSTNDIINWLSGLRVEPSHQVARFDGLFFIRAQLQKDIQKLLPEILRMAIGVIVLCKFSPI